MRKLFLFSLIVICVFLCACTTQEQSYSGLYPPNGSAGLAYEANEDGTCSVTGRGACTDQCIVIPSTSPSGQRVTAIKAKAFYYDDELLSITLPKTLERIGEEAFFACTRLIEIINLSNLEIYTGYAGYHGGIGKYAKEVHKGPGKIERQGEFFFYELDGKNRVIYYSGTDSDIVFPESLHGESYSLLSNLFAAEEDKSDKSIMSISFPDNALIDEIGSGAFKNCRALITVDFGNNCKLNSIGMFAFDGCFKLESVNFGYNNTLKTIGQSAFNRCANLRTFDFSVLKNLETIERAAFRGCTNLGAVKLPASVSRIEENAFISCRNITSFTFADGCKITEIPSDMLNGCYRLTEIHIPEGVTTIGASAFSGTGLKTIYLTAGLESVKYRAFAVDTNYVKDSVTIYYAGTEADFGMLDFNNIQWGLLVPSVDIIYDYKP